MHKQLLAAKLVMEQLTPEDIVSAARRAKAGGETGTALNALAALEGPQPGVALALIREWLREASVPLPTPRDAWTTIFDYYFAALVLGPPCDLGPGISEFMKNVANAPGAEEGARP